MSAIVFCGPTIAPTEAARYLDATFLAPAVQGDVYRAAQRRPLAIGIIDGCFDRVPSIWHKEILWALEEGIAVFGAASMGALRAAELAAFGMRGVGAVFADFASGRVEDDDEVAVVHAPAGSGWVALSEAMVNIRATLRAAAAAGVVGSGTRGEVERAAKRLHYRLRTYRSILDRAAAVGGVDRVELDALAAWLPAGRVDLKRLDAIAMLVELREHARRADDSDAGVRPPFVFERTLLWEDAARGAGLLNEDGVHVPLWQVLDELRLAGDARAGDEDGVARQLGRTRCFDAFVRRAASKQLALAERGLEDPAAGAREPGAVEQLLEQAVRWRLTCASPAAVGGASDGEADGEALVRWAESDAESFTRALLRELAYAQALEAERGEPLLHA